MPTSDQAPALVASFRPRARLLQLLGDQLIGSPRLAIFELVKNAYDADAETVVVTMRDLQGDAASIEVRDDGAGMDLATIQNVWLVPGHDHKAVQRSNGVRTRKGRMPLGEKGVGRFAVHKLGNLVEVVTKMQTSLDEVVIRIDWEDLTQTEFLADAAVEAEVRPASVFEPWESGTTVRVTSLRGESWRRGDVRRLARQITSISSPFADGTDDFTATLECPDQSAWLSDLPDTADLVSSAPWEFDFRIENNELTWTHTFRGVPNIALEPRTATDRQSGVLLDPGDLSDDDRGESGDAGSPPRGRSRRAVTSTREMQDGIGAISGRVYVWDRDPEVLKRMTYGTSLKTFLDDTGGIRVYRDNIRVYNYGEPGDDWLGLDLRRVNAPSKRVSNNIVVGAIELDLAASRGLQEKTNREGFVENATLVRFRALILGVLTIFESERNKDKAAIRKLLSKDRTHSLASIERPLEAIRKIARRHQIEDEVEPLLQTAQRSYEDMREIMLRAGVSNMSIVLVYHEVEHGMRLLERNLSAAEGDSAALEQARNLVAVIDGFGDILRASPSDDHDLRNVVRRAAKLHAVRLRNHDVTLEMSLPSETAEVPLAHLPFGLVLGAFTNLVDNSIYWLNARWPEGLEGQRRLFFGVDTEHFGNGPAIIVADNGPGFRDALGDLTEAFFTRRPGGLGVGLYYVNLIMQTIGGELRLLEPGDAALPAAYDGAAIALVFKRS